MSYILDALKKAADQRGETPAPLFRPLPAPLRLRGPSRRSWIALAVIMVAGGAIASTVVVVRKNVADTRRPLEPSAPVTATAPAVPAVPTPPAPRASATSAGGATTSEATPPTSAVPAPAPTIRPARPAPMIGSIRTPAGPGAPTARPRATRPPNTPPAAQPPTAARPSSPAAVAPSLPGVTASVPSAAPGGGLKLEVLAYSDVRAQRMVFINGRKYVEGDTIEGGPTVERILEDRVILNEQGRRFALH